MEKGGREKKRENKYKSPSVSGRKARQRLSHKGLILPQWHFCSFTVQYFSPSFLTSCQGKTLGFIQVSPACFCLFNQAMLLSFPEARASS